MQDNYLQDTLGVVDRDYTRKIVLLEGIAKIDPFVAQLSDIFFLITTLSNNLYNLSLIKQGEAQKIRCVTINGNHELDRALFQQDRAALGFTEYIDYRDCDCNLFF